MTEPLAPTASCATCLAFEPGDETHGQCRRYAPVSDPAGSALPVWPKVETVDWCLQHRQSEAPFGLTFIEAASLDTYGVGDA